MSLAGLN